jgi:hypothetical protein
LGLITGLLNPSLHSGRMDTLDASHCLGAQAFESLIDGAFDFLFRSFQVVESRALAVAKGSLALLAADDRHHLAALIQFHQSCFTLS